MCCRRPVYTISDLYSTILDVEVVELCGGVGSYVL